MMEMKAEMRLGWPRPDVEDVGEEGVRRFDAEAEQRRAAEERKKSPKAEADACAAAARRHALCSPPA